MRYVKLVTAFIACTLMTACGGGGDDVAMIDAGAGDGTPAIVLLLSLIHISEPTRPY